MARSRICIGASPATEASRRCTSAQEGPEGSELSGVGAWPSRRGLQAAEELEPAGGMPAETRACPGGPFPGGGLERTPGPSDSCLLDLGRGDDHVWALNEAQIASDAKK